MLQLEQLSWNAPNGAQILQNISLAVPDGKLTVITGPNGGGKTTLAKLIAGLEMPRHGRILLDGKEITNLDVTQRAKLGIGFAFQQPVRFKGFTVRHLLELAAGEGLSEDQLCGLLGQVGLCERDYAHRQVDASLSGGEIKRIEIATVLARKTRLAVFDEPEAGIDLWSFAKLIEVFQEIQGKLSGGLAIISHQERILKIADEIVVIDSGRVTRKGPAAEVLPGLLNAESSGGCLKKEAVFS